MRHEICESGLRHGKEFDDEYILAELVMINAKAGPHGHGGKKIQCSLRVAPHVRVEFSSDKTTNELLSGRGGVCSVLVRRS